MIVGDVSYHDYHGIALTDEEKDALQKSIGPYNKVCTVFVELMFI